MNFVKDVPGKFMEFGKNIIEGLIKGIKDFAGGVKDAIGGVVNGAKDFVKNTLGINSPSRVFRSFGASTMEGLTQGITRGAGAAITAMSNVTGKITAAGGVQVPGITFNGAKVTASESAANTSTGGGSRPKVEINFNGLVAGNPLEIARQIRRLLENEKELTGV